MYIHAACRSGDSTARLWRLGEGGVSGHTPSVVLPHQPVDASSQQDINRDVTTVHWNVRKRWRGLGSRERDAGFESRCLLLSADGWVAIGNGCL